MIAEAIRELLLAGMLLVTAAGLYALCYALGRLTGRRWLVRCSYGFAGLHVLGAVGMIVPDHLDPFWKSVVALMGIALLVVPPAMWWVVVTMHERIEAERAR